MDDIDRLTQLVEKLKLDNAYMGKIDEEDTQGIVYGVDSDDEGPTFQ